MIISQEWHVQTLKRHINKNALGYEDSNVFAFGMISAWLASGEITRKFFNELHANFVNNDEEETLSRIKKRYGRIL